MTSRSWFWLYRATMPSVRAQSIQVINMAHAMAQRGHSVTVAVEPPPGGRPTIDDILRFYGLDSAPTLHCRVLPSSRTLASAAFRAVVAEWVARHGADGIVYARSKRYAAELLRVAPATTLIVEAHEVDSLQDAERGEDPAPMRALEARVLAGAAGLVTNTGGTLALLRDVHPTLPPALVAHNGTDAGRIRAPTEAGVGVGYVGSVRGFKDLGTLARAARTSRLPIHLVGADPTDPLVTNLSTLSAGKLIFEAPLPHRAVPDRLARFRVLVLPASQGLFGQRLTAPLKLWDYFAAGVPVVAADTPALREAAGEGALYYPPGDEIALGAALDAVATDQALRKTLLSRARLRTWADRAAEVEAFVEGRS